MLMLEHVVKRCPKDGTKKFLQRVVFLLHIELELQDLNYPTPLYAD